MGRPADIECVLFDFDGVIADTEPLGVELLVERFGAIGVDVSVEEIEALTGTAGDEPFQGVLDAHHSTRTVAELFPDGTGNRAVYREMDIEPLPGIVDLIRGLRARGILVGLVSQTPTCDVMYALDRFRMTSLYDTIVCGDMIERFKPDPQPYERAMGFLDVAPGRTVVFEDSPTGIASARAAGTYVIGFRGGSIVQDTSAADESIDSFEGFSL